MIIGAAGNGYESHESSLESNASLCHTLLPFISLCRDSAKNNGKPRHGNSRYQPE